MTKRCQWCNLKNSNYIEYHDREWGQLNLEDSYLYEMLILESFQAGLSWECILNKRVNFQKAYDEFDLAKVCQYDETKINELLQNQKIVRNKLKIKASIENSKIFKSMIQEFGSFQNYLMQFTNHKIWYETDKVTNYLSDAISKDLQKRGMKFVGSTIIYSYLQAIGIIVSHEPECFLFSDQKDKTNREIKKIKSPQEVYQWVDHNIQYGWRDKLGKIHLNTMKDFRKIYQTLSIEETLQYQVGTCIEQVNLMHYLLDQISVFNKMFCCRVFEPDDYGNLEEEEHMHCFVLYYENGKVYHMEHPNQERKGIYEYNSEEEAIQSIVDYYIQLRGGKDSPTKEFFEVPVGISFQEFNRYINHISQDTTTLNEI